MLSIVLLLGAAHAAVIETDSLPEAMADAGRDTVLAIGEGLDPLSIKVHMRNQRYSAKLIKLPSFSPNRLEKLVKAMSRQERACGLLVDALEGDRYRVQSVGRCGSLRTPEALLPRAPGADEVSRTMETTAGEVAVWTGWTDDAGVVLAEVVRQHGKMGGVVTHFGAGSQVLSGVAEATGLTRSVRSEATRADALAELAEHMGRFDIPCGMAFEGRGQSRELWRVYFAGDCPVEAFHEPVDLRLDGATGEERERLQAEADARRATREAEAAADLEPAGDEALKRYTLPTPLRLPDGLDVPMAFGELIIEVDYEQVDLAGLGYRERATSLLERMGYDVPSGSEVEGTRFVVDGTLVDIREWEAPYEGMMVAVDWEVFDRSLGRVVYGVQTRGWVGRYFGDGTPEARANEVLDRNVVALLARQKLVDQVRAALTGALPEDRWGPPVALGSCPTPPQTMPRGAAAAIDASLVVRTEEGVGSAVRLTADGWVLTAAHVVLDQDEITLHGPDGVELLGTVVRAVPELDVALVHVRSEDARCVQTAGVPAIGLDAFAVGSPSGLDFSLSRGIVSAVRAPRGVPVIQTDASISPGNSGGPLLDEGGRLVGVVQSKAVGFDVEGIAFGIGAQAALEALGVQLGKGAEVDPEALRAAWLEQRAAVWDEPDPMPGE